MKQFWMIVAGACIVIAAVSLWRNHVDTAFVIATIGVLAWFLNYRSRMKKITADARETEAEADPNEANEN